MTKRPRRASPELGHDDDKAKVNKATGRPIRSGAGSKKTQPGYVDSVVIEEDMPVESCSEDDEGNPRQSRRTRKRKRAPSPTPPPLDPIIYETEAGALSDDESTEMLRLRRSTQPMTLVLNIPLGFHGPLHIRIDHTGLTSTRPVPETTATGSRLQGPSSQPATNIGFKALPPEIRNKIYRLLLVKKEFNFANPDNFSVSSAFLRTCKMVHSEGCSILYGENLFSFNRNRRMRAPFWAPTPQEIGYKDIHQFLQMIGPHNLSYLREVHMVFEDATQATTPYLFSNDDRRYVNDNHLIHCLRILRQANLRKFTMMFLGRRTLSKTDTKFLDYLTQVKADEVSKDNHKLFDYNKCPPALADDIIKAITRKPKLYI